MADDLLRLLQSRLASVHSPLLTDVRAAMHFTDGGRANWTVTLDHGRATAGRGRPANPAVTIQASQQVLADVVSGRRGGIAAFLDGDLSVRGNIALALELDGLFPGERPDITRALTRSLDAGGIRTFYLEAGQTEAPPVVLVHGLAATNASMLPLIPTLARDFHVLAPDLPGHGGSQAVTGNHGAEFFGNWLAAFIRGTCERPVVLVGHSLGGRAALQTALDFPDRVRGLVLICPAVAIRNMRQFVPFVRLVRDALARLPLRVPRAIVLHTVRMLFAEPRRIPASWQEAAVDEFTRIWRVKENRYSIFSAMRNIYLDRPFGEDGFWERLTTLTQPAVFLWGDRDVMVPATFAGHVEKALPSARSIVLPDCGHVPQFEHPEQTVTLARNFLGSLPALQQAEVTARRRRGLLRRRT